MTNSYPYLLEHNETGTRHVVIGEEKHTGQEKTFCGWLRDELNCHEASKRIVDSLEERSLCKICMMSEEVVTIVSREISRRKRYANETLPK